MQRRAILQRLRLVVVCVAVMLGVLCLQWSPHGPRLALRVEQPAQLRVGQEAALRLIIGNPHRRPVRLEDVDVASGYIQGLVIVGAAPAPRRGLWHERLQVFSMSYDQDLAPGALDEWVIRVKAIRPGRFRGEVAVYSATNVTSAWLDTRVIP